MKNIQQRALVCFMGFAALSVFNVNHSFAATVVNAKFYSKQDVTIRTNLGFFRLN